MSSESVLKGVALVNAQGETIQGDVVVQGKLLAFYFAVRSRSSKPALLTAHARY